MGNPASPANSATCAKEIWATRLIGAPSLRRGQSTPGASSGRPPTRSAALSGSSAPSSATSRRLGRISATMASASSPSPTILSRAVNCSTDAGASSHSRSAGSDFSGGATDSSAGATGSPGWVAFAQPFPNNRSRMELILPASWVGVASAPARHALSRRSCGCNGLWGSPGHTIWVCRQPRVRRRPPRRTGPTAYWLDGD